MHVIKKFILIMLSGLLIFCSPSLQAHEITYEIHGLNLSEAMQKNIQTALGAEHASPPKSILFIQRALEPFGYFKSSVRYKIINQQHIIYNINLGEPI
jgi:hypothetical protein